MEKVLYSKGIFEFLEIDDEFIVEGSVKLIKRTMIRRPPGIRALIVNKEEQKILFSKEFRYELNEWDYRLPGGKVFDSIEEYTQALSKGNIDDYAYQTVAKEVLEEVGFNVKNPKLIKISKDGASVIWDLYYYEITEYEVNNEGPKLEENEVINGYEWISYKDIIEFCRNNKIHEDRTIGVLLTYILNIKSNVLLSNITCKVS